MRPMKRLYNLSKCVHAIANIESQRIKVSRISDLNDPFELIAANLSERKHRRSLRGFREKLDKDHGILCFSRSWSNPVLWSHYADKHSGICLGFDVDEGCAIPVEYVSSLRDLDMTSIEAQNRGLHFPLEDDEVMRILRTKYEHWQYEDEMRVFVDLDHSTCSSDLYFMDFGPKILLREVIVGARCPMPLRDVVDLVAKRAPGVQVRKARLAFHSFSITEDLRASKAIKRFRLRAESIRG